MSMLARAFTALAILACLATAEPFSAEEGKGEGPQPKLTEEKVREIFKRTSGQRRRHVVALDAAPPDDALSRFAPPECLVWFRWNGIGPLPDNPTNRTQQLFADEEVRALFDRIAAAVGKSIAETSDGDSKNALAIAQIVATRPSVGYLTRIEYAAVPAAPRAPEPDGEPTAAPRMTRTIGPDGLERIGVDFTAPQAHCTDGCSQLSLPGAVELELNFSEAVQTATYHGAVIIHLGPRTAEFKKRLDDSWSGHAVLRRKTIAGVEWIAGDGATQDGGIAVVGEYFIYAYTESAARDAVAAIEKQPAPPAWLAKAEAQSSVKRLSGGQKGDEVPAGHDAGMLYVNVEGFKKLAEGPADATLETCVKSLGLERISSVTCAFGLDDQGTAVRTVISTPGGKDAPLTLDFLGAKGLAADDLRAIPDDATMAAAGKFDGEKLARWIAELAMQGDKPAETTALAAFEKTLAETLFIDLSKDIVGALGDSWCLYYSPREGGPMATTLTVAVKDEARLKGALEKLTIAAKATKSNIRRFAYRGHDVYYWHPAEADGGGCCAWCIADGRLIASLLPQTIKAHLARAKDAKTLADVPEVRRLVAGGEAPLVLAYTDTREILRWCYQYGSLLLPTVGQALAGDEVGLPFHEIPSIAVIEQYFAPSITTISRADSAVVIDSRQTIPFTSALAGIGALAAGGLASDSGDITSTAQNAVETAWFAFCQSQADAMRGVGGWHNLPPAQELMPSPAVGSPNYPAYSPYDPRPYPTVPSQTSYESPPAYAPPAYSPAVSTSPYSQVPATSPPPKPLPPREARPLSASPYFEPHCDRLPAASMHEIKLPGPPKLPPSSDVRPPQPVVQAVAPRIPATAPSAAATKPPAVENSPQAKKSTPARQRGWRRGRR